MHRDIKPENILLDKTGRVKIADFGLARIVGTAPEARRLTQAREVMGTPHYMAPEQVETPQLVDHRADIYSLGVVFYEMLTGELPLGRFAAPSRKVHVDVRLDEVVLRALEKEPERRYQQASQVKTDVQSVAGFAENLPPHLRARCWSYEYRSPKTLWGLPLLHIAFGTDLKSGKPLVARGVFAIGNIAKGLVAFGGLAFGGLTFGGLSIGVFSVGGAALGLMAIGGAAIALLFACGGGALAPIAVGGGAVGVFAMGGGAWGLHAIGGNVQDEVARGFFSAWAGRWLDWMMFLLVGVAMLVPLLLGVLTWFIKAERFHGTEQNRRRMRWALLATGLFTAAIWFVAMPRNNVWDLLLALKLPLGAQSSNLTPATSQTTEYDWQKLHDEGKLLGGTPVKLDGRTVLRIENSNDAPLQLSLFKIEQPAIKSMMYVVQGEIKYQNVQGAGYLEMWNYFPPASPGLPESQYFSRTLGEAGSGPMGRISGTASWRPLALAFNRAGTTNLPTRLEINIFLPGRGVVWLGPLRLMP